MQFAISNLLCSSLGFRRLRDFIVTQHPLVSTIKDFWQMVWDHNVQTVVLLSSLDEMVSLQFYSNILKNMK